MMCLFSPLLETVKFIQSPVLVGDDLTVLVVNYLVGVLLYHIENTQSFECFLASANITMRLYALSGGGVCVCWLQTQCCSQ